MSQPIRKIDFVKAAIQTDIKYSQIFKQFNNTKLEISEIFNIDYERVVNVFTEDILQGSYAVSVNPYSITEAQSVCVDLVNDKPSLQEKMTLDEVVAVAKYLYDIEKEISTTYRMYLDLGVSFDLVEHNDFNFKLLEDLLNYDPDESLMQYVDGEFSDEELELFIRNNLKEVYVLI
ncbi:hypothetical protein [Priestia megaterium]|jgi:hypothetical protein|uniref:hypothetical protein n=1 Tax=Priestia megaterium TaxID=1404 RepID=UPI00046E5886|nr:hypothetical protein [Priestia megaterium]MCM3018615.1 hypothetical protein [Priestia megaterium]MCM3195505.1 hypothetical protein [Priestia megaterium]PFB02303.1 hypothetical protein CN383_10395 [Priestia megaterium]TCN10745.1 hypothetical protein EV581_104135 [Bacillus sp. BK006]